METATTDPFGLAGTLLDGRFQIEREVAEGGFGVVYRATQVALDRPVAIKVLKTPMGFDEAAKVQFRDRFASEAKTIARIRHPHIVDVYDFGISTMPSAEIAPWMALEWLHGETLEDQLQRRRGQGGRSPAEVLATFRPILEAFAFAHKQGIAHRDIKPANIMAVPSDQGVTMQVLDFGIAKVANPDQVAGAGYSRTSSMPAFSPLYAAPEQIAFGRTGPWTDVHALGLVLTEMLTDQSPYVAEDKELFEEVMSHRRPTPATKGIDVGAWEPILQKALALSPSDRWKTASELLSALANSLQQPSIGAAAAGVAVDPSEPSRVAVSLPRERPANSSAPARNRSTLIWTTAGGIVLLGVAIAGVLGAGRRQQSPSEASRAATRPVPLVPPSVPLQVPRAPASASASTRPATLEDRPTTPPTPRPSIDHRGLQDSSPARQARRQDEEPTDTPERATTGAECAMSVNSVPWAEVWIDGQNTSQHTPVVDYRLPCGRHRLAFKRSDMHIDQAQEISLKAGQPLKQVFTLAAPSGTANSESPVARPAAVDNAEHKKPPTRAVEPASTGYHGSTLKIETQFP